MGSQLARKNSPSMKHCAFCKYFYDPANTVIAPKRGQKDVWEYLVKEKRPCLQKNNRETESQMTCPRFECKL